MSAAARPDRLIYMANQIARFFDDQPGDAAAGVAQHLKSFWDPQMRAEIVAWRAAGGEGLDPVAREAVGRLV
ncbi:MAG: formate dehydrogenase subunit delta [Phenylobacterium sp.]|uniref:formate dehydrogenase subunit delta n=1 Tax=Phenylobacterium sp. TaxID=1871053 RepID=UPI001A4981D1|nr:formate dehydrogenase subunit delta [Phenylobacterium sp.]MBL8554950.1 formate dehydrogenase subunit delta [Phenylobacterium sp.]